MSEKPHPDRYFKEQASKQKPRRGIADRLAEIDSFPDVNEPVRKIKEEARKRVLDEDEK